MKPPGNDQKTEWGPIVGIVIIVLLLMMGGVYFLFESGSTNSQASAAGALRTP